MKDQWDCVLYVLEELGNKFFLKYQYSTDISFLFLLLLTNMLSNDHPTNRVFVEIDSEEISWSSRIELLRRLLIVLFESVEEDWSLSSKSRTQRKKNLLVQYQCTFCHSSEWCLVHQQVLFFVVLHPPLIWLQKLSQSIVTLVLQVDLQELLCCCSSNQSRIYLIHEKFSHKIENYLFSETRFWFQFHVCRIVNWSWFPIRVQFLCFLESILVVVVIHHFLEECIHDRPLHEIV